MSAYQAIGEPHHSFVVCQECFAVVVAGDRAAHAMWHSDPPARCIHGYTRQADICDCDFESEVA